MIKNMIRVVLSVQANGVHVGFKNLAAAVLLLSTISQKWAEASKREL